MKQRTAALLMLLGALIWGTAFVAQSEGAAYVGPFTFVFARHTLTALLLFPAALVTDSIRGKKRERTPFAQYLKWGALCGVFLGAASVSQQAGMATASAGKAGFITTLYVVLVPVLGLLMGIRPRMKVWFSVALGVAGLYMISVTDTVSVQTGDLMLMLCALLFACQILCVNRFSKTADNPLKLSAVQFLAAAAVSFIGMLFTETFSWAAVRAAGIPILYAGILSGGVAYTLQIVAQKRLEPTVASLIMCMESVFAALAGYVFLNQVLSARETIGCAMVFIAVVCAEISSGKESI